MDVLGGRLDGDPTIVLQVDFNAHEGQGTETRSGVIGWKDLPDMNPRGDLLLNFGT